MHAFITLASSLLLATGAFAQSYGSGYSSGGGSDSGSGAGSGYSSGSENSSGSDGGAESGKVSSSVVSVAVATPSASSSSPASAGTVNVHIVKVSNKKGGLVFEPSSLKASVGSLVQFHFYPKNHSVVQSTFDKPCVPINNVQPSVPGIFSGYMPVKADAPELPAYSILINDTKPVWYYCSQGKHCQAGMVGVINPPAANKSRTVTTYAALAKDAPANVSPSKGATGDSTSLDNATPSGSSTSDGSDSSGSTSSGKSGSSDSSGSSDTTISGSSPSSSGKSPNSTTESFAGAGNALASRLDLFTGIVLSSIVGLFVAFA